MFFIRLATFLKSLKSLTLFPWIGYFENKGIIILIISENLLTSNSTVETPERETILPQPSSFIIQDNNSVSRICWVIVKANLILLL